MLYFEENIFYPIDHKTDYVKLSDTETIHYKVSSDRQNKRWFVAVTLEKDGKVTPQYQLSKQEESFGNIIKYIKFLPSIVQNKQSEKTIDYKMRADLFQIEEQVYALIKMLKEFKEKYNI